MKKILDQVCLFMLIFHISGCSSSGDSLQIQVDATEQMLENPIVSTTIELPAEVRHLSVNEIGVMMHSSDGSVAEIPGQVTEEEDGQLKLWWVIPGKDIAGEWTARFYPLEEVQEDKFVWQDDKGKHLDLIRNGKKVFRYEYELDDHFVPGETLTARNRVFYHIYDRSGQRFITNGYEEGVWSHHRGIMIGWRDVMHQGRKLSFWGMEQLNTQQHIEFLELTAGPVLARVKSRIHWNDSLNQTIIEEIRTGTIFHVPPPGLVVIDFTSDLTAVAGDVVLAGDAEHGGVQYRAHSDIAAETPGSKKASYVFHRDDIDPKVDHDLPWVGMSYDLDQITYSVVELNGRDNPKPAIWSAYRDYGRFGPYFSKNLKDAESFEVMFRFLIREGDMPSRAELDAHYNWFNSPASARIQ